MRLVSIIVLGAALVAALGAAPASAQTFTNACPDMPPDLESATDAAIEVRELGQRAVTICLAEVERLEALYFLQLDAIESETTTSAQRVALAPADRNRLDLAWWGVWGLMGTLLGLFAGQHVLRAFRFWRE